MKHVIVIQRKKKSRYIGFPHLSFSFNVDKVKVLVVQLNHK